MSGINKVTAVAAGLTLLIAFSLAGYILGFGLGEQSGEHQANADTYAKHAQNEIDGTCADLNGPAHTECIIRVVEATNEHERAESDLNAQRDMARWAFLMLIVTVAMAIITAFGVFYVWRTLLATQKMAEETTRIGEAQVRAYLTIKDMTIGFDDSLTCPQLQMTLANTGQSPARKIEIVLRFSFFPAVEGAMEDFPELPVKHVRWWFDDVPGNEKVTCIPNVFSDVRVEGMNFGPHLERLSGIHLSVAIFSEDVFHKEITTFGHFALGWAEGEDRRKMKRTSDFTRVQSDSVMIENLRPYRLGHEKDGQG